MENAEAFGFIFLIIATFATAILYFVQLYRFAAVLKRDHSQLW